MTPLPRSIRALGPALAVLSLSLFLAACEAPRQYGSGGMGGPGQTALGLPGSLPGPGELTADPGRFKGLAARDVVAALGDPNFRRREPPAEVWQYYGASCVLDLFLYDDGGAPRVDHVEFRSRSAGQGAQSSCLSQLLEGKRGQQAS